MMDKMMETDSYLRIKAVLQRVVFKSVSLDNVTPQSRLLEDLEIDSARLVDLVLSLEDEFAISIEDDAIEKIKTVQDLMNLVREKAG
jgi:acyl carrier protein